MKSTVSGDARQARLRAVPAPRAGRTGAPKRTQRGADAKPPRPAPRATSTSTTSVDAERNRRSPEQAKRLANPGSTTKLAPRRERPTAPGAQPLRKHPVKAPKKSLTEIPEPGAADLAEQAEVSSAPAPRAPFVLLVLGLITAALVGLVLLNTAINENAFRLHSLQKEQKALDLSEQQLQRDVAQLQSAGALDAAARRLGLVPAGQAAFIQLPSGTIIGKPTPAGTPAKAAR